MACHYVKLPGVEGVAIVCDRSRPRVRRCSTRGCTRIGSLQCDFPIGNGRTCDKYLCADCAVPQGPDKDFCPSHPRPGERPAAPAQPSQGDLFR